jgi:hypothetical protein
MVVGSWFMQDYWINDRDGADAQGLAGGTIQARLTHERAQWRIRIELSANQTMTANGWLLEAQVKCFEGDELVKTRKATANVKRQALSPSIQSVNAK